MKQYIGYFKIEDAGNHTWNDSIFGWYESLEAAEVGLLSKIKEDYKNEEKMTFIVTCVRLF